MIDLLNSIENPKGSFCGCDLYGTFLKELLFVAKEKNASDIHIEPTGTGVGIKLRISGDIEFYQSIGVDRKRIFYRDLKKFCGLKVEYIDIPQDSSFVVKEYDLSIRVASRPLIYGEKVVLRLFPLKFTGQNSILAMPDVIQSNLKLALKKRQGLILVCGPTGSGKTTTLYEIITSLNDGIRSIETIEDPVEIQLDGINQSNVTTKIGFDAHLKALLRLDPDIILVGEIRDRESAKLALRAASTGHLVFSTIHTTSSLGAIERLIDLGGDKSLIQENLELIISQRLYQKICPECSIKSCQGRFKNEEGCPQCKRGVIGRVPIFEACNRDSIENYLTGSDVSVLGLSHYLQEKVQSGHICLREKETL